MKVGEGKISQTIECYSWGKTRQKRKSDYKSRRFKASIETYTHRLRNRPIKKDFQEIEDLKTELF